VVIDIFKANFNGCLYGKKVEECRCILFTVKSASIEMFLIVKNNISLTALFL